MNDIYVDGIEKIPQSHTGKVDSSKSYHPEKDCRFLGTIFRNQKQSCQHELFEKYPWLDNDITSDSVTLYFLKYQNSLNNLIAEQLKV